MLMFFNDGFGPIISWVSCQWLSSVCN